MFEITLIINAHREGRLILPTLQSVNLSANYARLHGWEIEVICLLDRPDTETCDLVREHGSALGFHVECADHGDLALARNHGAELATNDIVAFVDGDDLISENWLIQAGHCVLNSPRTHIWHPAVNYIFGDGPTYLFSHRDMEHPDFDLKVLVLQNYWTALSMAFRQTYLNIPYRANRLDSGWGYEDWTWACETISEGYLHKVVPLTAHYIRRKSQNSLLRATNNQYTLPDVGALWSKLREV